MTESLEEWLFRMDRRMQVSGMRPLNPQELQMLAKRYQQRQQSRPAGGLGGMLPPPESAARAMGGMGMR